MTDLKTRLTAAGGVIRRNAVSTGVELLINFVLPFVIFSLAKPQLGEANALIVSSAPPIVWSIVEFVRRRRVDALSLLVLAGIALSLLAFIGGGGVRFLQLRERMVTGLIGLIFLGSAAIGRPLIYYLARASMMRSSPERAAHLAAIRDAPGFKRTMLIMTLAWGFGLVTECAIAVALTFALTVKQFMIAGPIVGYGIAGALTAWTYWFARRRLTASMRASIEAAHEPGAAGGEPVAGGT